MANESVNLTNHPGPAEAQQLPQGRKIALVGFADSRDQAPYNDPTWELWGVNDLYHYVPRLNVTFELHHIDNLHVRRNPRHEEWLRKGKMPVWMVDPRPEFPSSQRFPFEQVMKDLNCSYFTNSIAWMTALAVLELTMPLQLPDGRFTRIAKPGAELALFGIDMAASSEYGSQRPSCEYHVGLAQGFGVPVYIPPTSDLCKASSLYGLDTTANLRIKLQAKQKKIKDAINALENQRQQTLNQERILQSQIDQHRGALEANKYVIGVWTMPTDIPIGAQMEAKDRGEGMPGSESFADANLTPASDNNHSIPAEVS